MSMQSLSDGQHIETSNIDKVELYEYSQNLLVTLKSGHLVGVHSYRVVHDAKMLEALKRVENLTFQVYRKGKASTEFLKDQDQPLSTEELPEI